MAASVYINNQLIDLYPGYTGLSLFYSITDASNLSSRGKSSSKIIKVPGTRRNRLIFGFPEDIHSQELVSIGADIKGRIEEDDGTSMSGQVKYVRTVIINEKAEYQFIIVGQNNWVDKLSTRLFNQSDFSYANHYLEPFYIQKSHSDLGLLPYLYLNPIPERTDKIFPSEFRFAFNLRRVFIQFLKEAGYRVVSAFLDGLFFSKLYYRPALQKKDSEYWEKKKVIAGNSTAHDFFTGHPQTFPWGDGDKITYLLFDNTSATRTSGIDVIKTGYQDPSNLFNQAEFSNKFRADETGGYKVSFNLPLEYQTVSDVYPEEADFPDTNDDCDETHPFLTPDMTDEEAFLPEFIDIELLINGNLHDTITFEMWDIEVQRTRGITGEFKPYLLNAGDFVEIRLKFNHVYNMYQKTTLPYDYIDLNPVNFQINAWEAELTVEAMVEPVDHEFIDINQFYLGSEAQINLIKDCAILANLQFVTNEYTKTVFIEPAGNFYNADSTDITEKLDQEEEINITNLAESYDSTISFTYKDEKGTGSIENKNIFSKEGSPEKLSFFTTSSIQTAQFLYSGALVFSESENKNQLLYLDPSFRPGIYQAYAFNAEYRSNNRYLTATNLRFNDNAVNLSFADGEVKGLLSTFYADLIRDLNTLKLVEANILWEANDISKFDSEPEDLTQAYRALYQIEGLGRFRLQSIQDYEPGIRQSSKTLFVQDNIKTTVPVTPVSHQALRKDLPDMYVLYWFLDSISLLADGFDPVFSIKVENLSTLNRDEVTIMFPYFKDDTASPFFTFDINSGQLKTLNYPGNSSFLFGYPLINRIDLFSYGHLTAPVRLTTTNYFDYFIAEFGVLSKVNAGVSFNLNAGTQNAPAPNPNKTGFIEITINGQTYSSGNVTFVAGGTNTFSPSVTINEPGSHEYTIRLNVAGDDYDILTHKLYVHE